MKKTILKTIFFMLIFSFSIFPTTYTLQSGGSTNWNSKSQWVPRGIPTAADTVILPSGSNNLVIDVNAVCAKITIEAGYTGVITFDPTFTLTVSGDWINNGAPVMGSGSVLIGGNFTNYDASLDVTTTEFTFYGSGDQTVYSASAPVPSTTTFGSLVVDKTLGTFTLLSDLAVEISYTETGVTKDENGYSFWVNGVPLPVELSSFTADILENSVKLKWRTETEVNNYGFSVLRLRSATENNEWEEIGFVIGHGNSNSPKEYEFIDEDAPSEELEYRLMQIDTDGGFEYYHLTAKVDASITDVEDNSLPTEFALEQNYPNPFNPTTMINYSIKNNSKVVLDIYNTLGQKVAELFSGTQNTGTHSVSWNATGFSSGTYFARFTASSLSDNETFTEVKKLLLIK